MAAITPTLAWEVFQRADRLFAGEEVEAALERMAAEITARLGALDPVLVCIMTGGVVPFGRLLPRLAFPLRIDYVHATRYGEKLTGGHLQWHVGPSIAPAGQTILLVDDILDEGTTLAGIEDRYRADGASDVLKAALIVKDRPRTIDITVEFEGLRVPNRYVFGYGMDYKGYLRNTPGIYAEAEGQ